MKLGADAMAAALEDLQQLQYSTQLASLYESFLVARWLTAHDRYPELSVADVNEAVSALFVLHPDHDLGRLAPFRSEWRQVADSGRKTVWNITTRGPKLATTIFDMGDRGGGDIRQGLLPDAASILGGHLADSPRPSLQSLICLVLSHHDFGAAEDWNTATSRLCEELGMDIADLAEISDRREISAQLLGPESWDAVELPVHLLPPSPVRSVSSSSGQEAGSEAGLEIVLDKRLETMLERAVASYPCILLVGPPGTGKGTLLRWIVQRVMDDPNSFGFSDHCTPNPIWRTPDESWGAFELVGGLVPNSVGQIEWSDGLVPTAVQEDRWLILDEMNRADMDKIMGPLLTWLSGQAVEIGRTVPHGGTPIVLDWTDTPRCRVERPSNGRSDRRLLTGREWRLLGTYNPQDAQRVFRFGQALARRFVVIPVPAISPGQMDELLSARYVALATDVIELIADLYRMHYDSPSTVLGPAVFLRMAEYVAGSGPGDVTEDAVTEAYVINTGRYLASYDDSVFEDLGQRIRDVTTLTESSWAWIRQQRNLLS